MQQRPDGRGTLASYAVFQMIHSDVVDDAGELALLDAYDVVGAVAIGGQLTYFQEPLVTRACIEVQHPEFIVAEHRRVDASFAP
jgi:hypothetical protein